MVNAACQLDRIQHHLEYKPLGMSLRIFLTGLIAVIHPMLVAGDIAPWLEILGGREMRMLAEYSAFSAS